MNDEINIPRRNIGKISKNFISKKDYAHLNKLTNDELATTNQIILKAQNLEEIWKSKPLTERDLNIPTGKNTNLTGSMLWKKGLLKNIDPRHYFRDVIFKDLIWNSYNPKKAHLEQSSANFKIMINGIDKGEFELTLNHNTDKSSKAYAQNNSMTNISWGKAKHLIRNKELLGKTLTLYKNQSLKCKYIINIE